MKKLLIILFFIAFASITASAEISTVDSTGVNQNLKYVAEKMEGAINVFAQKLKVPAEHVYKIMIRQQATVAVTELFALLCIIFTTLLFFLSYRKNWKLYKNEKNYSTKSNLEDTYQVMAGWSIGGLVITIVLFFLFTIDGLPRLINPEYYAIKDIFSILRF